MIRIKPKTIGMLLTLLLVISAFIIIFQMSSNQALTNEHRSSPDPTQPSTPTNSALLPSPSISNPPLDPPTSVPSGAALGKFQIGAVTINPPVVPMGQSVSIMLEVQNLQPENQSALVNLEVEQPDGTMLTILQDNQVINSAGSSSQTVIFPLATTVNQQPGKYLVKAEIYDLTHTNLYYSTGYNYSFNVVLSTVMVQFLISPTSIAPKITVDQKEYSFPANFNWYLNSVHSFTVPKMIPIDATHSWTFIMWSDGKEENSRQYMVTNALTLTAIYALSYTPQR
jgi:hypothetical protein